MNAWVVTVPQTVAWSDYTRELAAVEDGHAVMNYRLPHVPKDLRVGDRCYIVHAGQVRGWMAIVGRQVQHAPWRCSTSGRTWPAGVYIQRSGPFHPTNGPAMVGFRGIRKFTGVL